MRNGVFVLLVGLILINGPRGFAVEGELTLDDELTIDSEPGPTANPTPNPTTSSTPENVEGAQPTPTPNPQTPPPVQAIKDYIAKTKTAKPVFFEPLDNGVKLGPLEFDYDLSAGDTLKIGPITIEENALLIRAVPLSQFDRRLPGLVNSGRDAYVVTVNWPEELIENGRLEAISRRGDVAWSTEINEARKADWQATLDRWSRLLGDKKLRRLTSSDLQWKSNFGIPFAKDSLAPVWEGQPNLRFCLTQAENINHSMLCTASYRVRTVGKTWSIVPNFENTKPRAIVQNEPAPLKNRFKISKPDESFLFFGELSSGLRVELTTIPGQLHALDLVQTSDPNWVRLTGFDQKIFGDLTEINPEDYASFKSKIGWQPTLGDLRRFWTVLLPSSSTEVYLMGKTGGLFRQPLTFSSIPPEKIRPWVDKKSLAATYSNGSPIWGQVTPGTQVTSQENEVSRDGREFTWWIRATTRGELNRSHLSVLDEQTRKKWNASYEIYKAYPVELSGRLTGILASQGSSVKMGLLGEVAFNYWAQSLLGWNEYYVARQRWGVSAKYFQSVASVNLVGSDDSAKKSIRIKALSGNIKYRFSPGVWGRDETWGLIGAYQKVSLDDLDAPLAGGGFFWGRSMPKLVDDLINIIKYLRYPKFTDLEFIYYPMSLSANSAPIENWDLNFHGKVFWSYSVFGEFGVGLKRYSFNDKKLNQKASFVATFTTMGLGINF